MPSFPRLARPIAALLFCLLAPVGVYAGYLGVTGNIHEVVPGALYRSGQLGEAGLEDLIAERGIRTIVNLRGAHPGTPWYDEESALAAASGIRYVPISLSAKTKPPLATMLQLAEVMRDAPRPILVHCLSGADRTGLAAAIFELVAPEGTAQEAAGQLSIAFGHMPWFGNRSIAMDRAFSDFSAYWTHVGQSATTTPAG